MGNEQTRERNRNEGMTRQQVAYLMEQQRLEFEAKMNSQAAATRQQAADAARQAAAAVQVATEARASASAANIRNSSDREASTRLSASPRPTVVEHEVLPTTAVLSAFANSLRESSPTTASTSNYPLASTSNSRLPQQRHIYPKLPSAPSAPPAPCPPFRMPNASSSPRPRSELNRDLNCPTCGYLFSLRLYNCGVGHAVCEPCKLSGVRCGKQGCGKPVTDQRNFGVEGFISQQQVACMNRQHGCTLTLKLVDLELHGRECPFRELSCPLPRQAAYCPWKGRLEQLASHFDAAHPQHRVANIDKEMFIDTRNHITNQFFLIVMGPYHFLVFTKLDYVLGKMYMAVQLVGTTVSAAKWSYELHLYNKAVTECHRKFVYSDVCTSNVTPFEELMSGGKCMVLPQEFVLTYVDNRQRLTYKIYIKKECDKDGNDSGGSGNFRGRGRGGRGARGRGRGRGRHHATTDKTTGPDSFKTGVDFIFL